MGRPLIIGMGSEIRGDDALGPIVVSKLAQRFSDKEVECKITHTLTPELAGLVSHADYVLFVDASKEGDPGEIKAVEIKAASGTDLSMVHFLDPPALLTWARLLYNAEPKAMMVSVVGKDFAFRERTLSPEIQALMPHILALCEETVNSWLSTTG